MIVIIVVIATAEMGGAADPAIITNMPMADPAILTNMPMADYAFENLIMLRQICNDGRCGIRASLVITNVVAAGRDISQELMMPAGKGASQ